MKKVFISIIALFFCATTFSQTYVSGYYKSNGTYVQGHYRTAKDDTNHNNWSTSGNTNLYTGTTGSVARDYSPQATNYGQGKTIHTGPQGGQYYNNNNGNRTYVPKQPTTNVYQSSSNFNSSCNSSSYKNSSKSSYKNTYWK